MLEREYVLMRRHEESHWFYLSTHALVLRRLRRALPGGGHVCDAGCGTGGLLARMLPHYDALGFDLHAPAVRMAAARPGLAGRVVVGRMEAAPFRSGAFDAVTSIDTLYHVRVEETAAVREFARLLRPGGTLLVQANAFECLRGAHDKAVMTRKRYRLREMTRRLEGAGLRVRNAFYRFPSLFLPMWAVRRFGSRESGSDLDTTSLGRPLDRVVAALVGMEDRAASLGRLPFGCSVFVEAEKAEGAGARS